MSFKRVKSKADVKVSNIKQKKIKAIITADLSFTKTEKNPIKEANEAKK